jgi:5-methylcytosine-specific restriction endonuclease McrA
MRKRRSKRKWNTNTAKERKLQAFYLSDEWRKLSWFIKEVRGRRCEKCGATARQGVKIVTDHVKPIRHFWQLRLDSKNLQVLCDDCNYRKGSRDQTDYRKR